MDASDGSSQVTWPVFTDRGIVLEYTLPDFGNVVSAASDATVVYQDGRYTMVFTCVHYESDPPSTQLCTATSSDGIAWNVPATATVPGELLRGNSGSAAARLESAELVADGANRHLYYSAYPDPDTSDPAPGYPADLYLAQGTSLGGVTLTATTVLDRQVNGPDHDAIYSPSIVQHQGQWAMVYSAHCFPRPGVSCEAVPGGVSLITASAPNARGPWTRNPGRIELSAGWVDAFAAEVSLASIDGQLWMFATGFSSDEKPRTIGMARASTLAGPWDVALEPIARATDLGTAEIVAPSVVVLPDAIRLYITWIGSDEIARVRLLEAPR